MARVGTDEEGVKWKILFKKQGRGAETGEKRLGWIFFYGRRGELEGSLRLDGERGKEQDGEVDLGLSWL